MKKILVLFFTCMLIASPASAQKHKPSKYDVVLTVSADGSTKNEAIMNALRSAIEQAYGTFVSANTAILNDELVKDEIVTVSNGSIKTYKEISALQTNNEYFVTLTATVSLPQLIKYAESHGSECEFAGNTFGMEMKMFELQKKNELKALYNLTDQVVAMLPNVMKYEMTIGEPTLADHYLSDVTLFLTHNVDEKAKALLKQFDYSNMEQTKKKYYCIPIDIKWTTEEKDRIPNFIMNNLSAITLKYEEYENAERRNLDVSSRKIGKIINQPTKTLNAKQLLKRIIPIYIKPDQPTIESDNTYFFRNTYKDINKWLSNFYTRIENKFNEFVIKDNTGTESTFYPKEIVLCDDSDSSNGIADKCPMLCTHGQSGWGICGSGIFYNAFQYQKQYYKRYSDIAYITTNHHINEFSWSLSVFIPEDDLAKYSKFWVEPKPETK